MGLLDENSNLNFIIIKIMNIDNCLLSNVLILCTPVPSSKPFPFEFISANGTIDVIYTKNGTIDIIIYINFCSRKKY